MLVAAWIYSFTVFSVAKMQGKMTIQVNDVRVVVTVQAKSSIPQHLRPGASEDSGGIITRGRLGIWEHFAACEEVDRLLKIIIDHEGGPSERFHDIGDDLLFHFHDLQILSCN